MLTKNVPTTTQRAERKNDDLNIDRRRMIHSIVNLIYVALFFITFAFKYICENFKFGAQFFVAKF